MKTSNLSLPSGLKVKVRALTLDDDAVVFSKKEADSIFFEVCLDLLDACTIEVLDPGPHKTAVVDGKIDWRKALIGDAMSAFFGLRIVSYDDGNKYELDFTCPFCGEYISWWADLRTVEEGGDIIDYPIADEVKESVEAGNALMVEIDDHIVEFRLQTVEDFLHSQKLSIDDKKNVRSLAFIRRTVDLTGPSIKNPNDKARWLRGLDSNQAKKLQDAMNDVDPGIDSSVDVTCPNCLKESEVTVPFDAYFFIPRDAQKKRRASRKAQLKELRRQNSSSRGSATAD